jgi:hypothetical protein
MGYEDERAGRPLVNGRDHRGLSKDGLEVEVTIAAAEPRHRGMQPEALLLERARPHAAPAAICLSADY